jgi:hypothetical protein
MVEQSMPCAVCGRARSEAGRVVTVLGVPRCSDCCAPEQRELVMAWLVAQARERDFDRRMRGCATGGLREPARCC